MIQFKRGSKKTWPTLRTPLADGQPGYDRDSHKIKIGNGKDLWSKLPYASGLFAEEIFSSEENAKNRNKADDEDKTIITYGTNNPDKNTVGQLYLQYYETDPETDYIVDCGGANGYGWTYQKWNSGIAHCYGTFEVETAMKTQIGNGTLYQNSSSINKILYPFTFINAPSEIASVQSPGGLVWIAASKGINTKAESAGYSLLSLDQLESTTYRLTLDVKGYWK